MVSTIVGFVDRKTRKTRTISGRPPRIADFASTYSDRLPDRASFSGRFLTGLAASGWTDCYQPGQGRPATSAGRLSQPGPGGVSET